MSASFAQKALARAAGLDHPAPVGDVVMARPDIILSHDNTAAISEIWQRFGQSRIHCPECLAITLDHAVPAPTPRHAANHQTIRRLVEAQGIRRFYEAGRGICHQVLSEEAEPAPGDLILGADSHTPHFGWMGAFGAGIGRSEVAALWARGELWLRVPETLRIRLRGQMPPWVSAKDLALALIGRLGADGALYRCVEFDLQAGASLELAERMVLANMMAEMGAKAAYLAPDQKTFQYLAERRSRRLGCQMEHEISKLRRHALYPDPDSAAEEVSFDLTGLGPQVACPHQVDSTRDVRELEHIRVHQAFLGTCTNGRLEDLAIAHHVLQGRRLARGTRLLIVPASSEVLRLATERGWISDFVAAGAMIGTPGCGPCMGNHMGVLAAGEACVSSANRNFRGRMGTRDAEIYLASPAVVAASAVTGRLCSPHQLAIEPPLLVSEDLA